MKRFQFRAAKVLDLRRREHDAALAQLSRVQQLRDSAAAAASAADTAVEGAQREYRDRLAEGGEASTFERHRNWIAGLHAGAESCRRQLAVRQTEVERATADVRRTHRQVLVIEKLRERAWQAYQEENRRLDAIAMDQLAVTQFARRM